MLVMEGNEIQCRPASYTTGVGMCVRNLCQPVEKRKRNGGTPWPLY